GGHARRLHRAAEEAGELPSLVSYRRAEREDRGTSGRPDEHVDARPHPIPRGGKDKASARGRPANVVAIRRILATGVENGEVDQVAIGGLDGVQKGPLLLVRHVPEAGLRGDTGDRLAVQVDVVGDVLS